MAVNSKLWRCYHCYVLMFIFWISSGPQICILSETELKVEEDYPQKTHSHQKIVRHQKATTHRNPFMSAPYHRFKIQPHESNTVTKGAFTNRSKNAVSKVRPYTGKTSYHVVVSQPRSGSTFISQLLASHPCIINVEEALRLTKKDLDVYNSSESLLFHTRLLQHAQEPELSKVRKCSNRLGVGWKQFFAEHPNTHTPFYFYNNTLQSANLTQFLPHFLTRTDTRVVLLMRRNLLEYHVSRGYKMPHMRHRAPQHCGVNQKICDLYRHELESIKGELDFIKVRSFILSHRELQRQAYRSLKSMAEKYGVKVLYVPYEAVVEDEKNASKLLLHFLGFQLPNVPLEAKVEKRHNLQFDRFFTNWADVPTELERICDGCSIYSYPGIEGVPMNERMIQLL